VLPQGKPKEISRIFVKWGKLAAIRRERENGDKINCVNDLQPFINGRGIPRSGNIELVRGLRMRNGCGDGEIIVLVRAESLCRPTIISP
jgi:hypothetical protein